MDIRELLNFQKEIKEKQKKIFSSRDNISKLEEEIKDLKSNFEGEENRKKFLDFVESILDGIGTDEANLYSPFQIEIEINVQRDRWSFGTPLNGTKLVRPSRFVNANTEKWWSIMDDHNFASPEFYFLKDMTTYTLYTILRFLMKNKKVIEFINKKGFDTINESLSIKDLSKKYNEINQKQREILDMFQKQEKTRSDIKNLKIEINSDLKIRIKIINNIRRIVRYLDSKNITINTDYLNNGQSFEFTTKPSHDSDRDWFGENLPGSEKRWFRILKINDADEVVVGTLILKSYTKLMYIDTYSLYKILVLLTKKDDVIRFLNNNMKSLNESKLQKMPPNIIKKMKEIQELQDEYDGVKSRYEPTMKILKSELNDLKDPIIKKINELLKYLSGIYTARGIVLSDDEERSFFYDSHLKKLDISYPEIVRLESGDVVDFLGFNEMDGEYVAYLNGDNVPFDEIIISDLWRILNMISEIPEVSVYINKKTFKNINEENKITLEYPDDYDEGIRFITNILNGLGIEYEADGNEVYYYFNSHDATDWKLEIELTKAENDGRDYYLFISWWIGDEFYLMDDKHTEDGDVYNVDKLIEIIGDLNISNRKWVNQLNENRSYVLNYQRYISAFHK